MDGTYTEQYPSFIFDSDGSVTVSDGGNYGTGYLEITITTNAQTDDSLSINSSSYPPSEGEFYIDEDGTYGVANGVYLGQVDGYPGDNPTLIGIIDAAKNGKNSSPLKINFENPTIIGGVNPITNGDFSDGLNNWTSVQSEVILGSNLPGTSIPTPENDEIDYPNKNCLYAGCDDNDLSSQGTSWETDVQADGRLRLQEKRMWVASYGVVHGPAVYSDIFTVDGGGNLIFNWQANYVNDDYHVVGYLFNADDNSYIVCLGEGESDDFESSNEYGVSGVGNWGSNGEDEVKVTVPQTGNYRFVFISGTFDRTGGTLAGASMFIDNVRVEDAMVLDGVVESLIENIQFKHTGDNPLESKDIKVTIQDFEGKADSISTSFTVTPVNDDPIKEDVNGSGNEGETITTVLEATDVDDDNDPLDLTFEILSLPSNIVDGGLVTIADDLSYDNSTRKFTATATYTHDDTQTTSDSFTYKANDGELDTEVANASITINPVNDAPISTDVNESGSEGELISTTLIATDVDSDCGADNSCTESEFEFIIENQPAYKAADIQLNYPGQYDAGTITIEASYTHDSSENFSDSFTYKANDKYDSSNADSNTSTATITITPVNDAPIASDVNGNGDEGATISTTLTATDSDFDANSMTFTIISPPAYINGSIDLSQAVIESPEGTFTQVVTYTHDNSQTTSDSFTYKANDGIADSDGVGTATITINPTNDPPETIDVSGSGVEGGTISTTLTATDVDDDDNPLDLTFIIVNQPTYISGAIDESASITYSGGTFTKVITYTHDDSENFSDSFTYQVNDGDTLSKPEFSTANISITPVNEAPIITSNGGESTANISKIENYDISNEILTTVTSTDEEDGTNAGDYSISGTDQTAFSIDQSSGVLNFIASPDYENPIDSDTNNVYEVIVTVTDDGGLQDSQTITVTVTNENEPPVLSTTTDSGSNTEATATFTFAENSSDAITVIESTDDEDGSNAGTYTLSGTDASDFSIDAGTRELQFNSIPDYETKTTYEVVITVTDNDSSTDTQTLTINIQDVNEQPVAADVNGSGNEGETITTTLTATDVDNDDVSTFIFTIVTPPANIAGSINIGSISYSSGTFSANATYTHDGSETTSDSFTYKANDGESTIEPNNLDSNTATATITITPVNDAPITTDSTENDAGNEGETISITITATDADDDSSPLDLTFEIISGQGPTHITGSIDNSADVVYDAGTGIFSQLITYTHDGSENFVDIFRFKANDGDTDSDPAYSVATVNLNPVNDNPEITSNRCYDGSNNALNYNTQSNCVSNSGTWNNGDTGTISYDELGTIAVTTVTATDAEDDLDGSLTLNYSISGTDNTLFTIDSNTGALSFNTSPDYENPIDSDANNSYVVIVTATDNSSAIDSQTLTINVQDVNEPPVAQTLTAAGPGSCGNGTTITGTLVAIDPDSDCGGDACASSEFSFCIVDQPPAAYFSNISIATPEYSSGTFTAVATFTISNNLICGDNFQTFTYKANDGECNGDTESNTVTANIHTGTNVAPTTSDLPSSGTISVDEGSSIAITLESNDSSDDNICGADWSCDPASGENFTFSIISQPSNATSSISTGSTTQPSTNNEYRSTTTYTHDGNESTNDSFTYRSNDGTLDSDISTVTITINPVNDAPVSTNVNGNGDEGATITTTLIATDVDNNDVNSFTFSIVNPPANITGSVSIGSISYSSGTFSADATYTHNGSEIFSDNFTYKANDGELSVTPNTLDSNTSTATITINPVNDAPIITSNRCYDGSSNGLNYNVQTDCESNSGTWNNGDTGTISYDENATTTVTSVTSTDDDSGSTASYSISGTDVDDFLINSSSGALTFINSPDYENPTDDNQDKTYIVIVTVTDDAGATDSQTLTININDLDEAPITSDVNGSGDEDQCYDASGNAVSSIASEIACIANDASNTWSGGTITVTLTATDLDSDCSDANNCSNSEFYFTIKSNPNYISGSFNTSANVTYNSSSNLFSQIITYKHDGSESTFDSFTFEAHDGISNSNISTANISINPINDAPVITFNNGDSYSDSYDENDTSPVITLTSDDPEDGSNVGDYSISGGLDADDFTIDRTSGILNFISVPNYEAPTDSDWDGSNSDRIYIVEIKVTDDGGLYDTQTLTITLLDLNDPPICNLVNGNGFEGLIIGIDADGNGISDSVILECIDEESNSADDLTFQIVSEPSYRSTDIDASGNVSYDNSTGIFSKLVTYVHDGTENFSDSFTYTATDNDESNAGGPQTSAEATANISITPVNDPPIPADIDGNGYEQQCYDSSNDLVSGITSKVACEAASYIWSGGIISTTLTATDVDIDATYNATASNFSFNIITTPSYIDGSIDLTQGIIENPEGTFTQVVTYRHDGSENFSDSFTYKANDGTVDSDVIATASITITPVNDPPITTDINGSGNEGETITLSFIATDVDDDDNPLDMVFSIVNQPNYFMANSFNETESIDYSSGTFTKKITYTHDGTENFTDSLTYKVNDGNDDSNISKAYITIAPVNDPPQLADFDSSPKTFEDTPITLSFQIIDPDNSNHIVTTESFEPNVTVNNNISTTTKAFNLNLTSTENWPINLDFGYADISFTITETDISYSMDEVDSLSVSSSFQLSVEQVNDPPTLVELTAPDNEVAIVIDSSTVFNSKLTLDWEASSDVDKDTLTYLYRTRWDDSNWPSGYENYNEKVGNMEWQSSGMSNTEQSFTFEEIFDALKYDEQVWQYEPILLWWVDVSDGDTTVLGDCNGYYEILSQCSTVHSINVGYYGGVNLSADNLKIIPTEFNLYQNYPNPFNPYTKINYDLASSGKVKLTIYNLLGREVITLVNDFEQPGRYSLNWDGRDKYNQMVSSGMYFYFLSTPEYQSTKKMILLK